MNDQLVERDVLVNIGGTWINPAAIEVIEDYATYDSHIYLSSGLKVTITAMRPGAIVDCITEAMNKLAGTKEER